MKMPGLAYRSEYERVKQHMFNRYQASAPGAYKEALWDQYEKISKLVDEERQKAKEKAEEYKRTKQEAINEGAITNKGSRRWL